MALGIRRLLRLSELRAEQADRQLRQRQAELNAAEQAIQSAREEAEALSRQIAQQRDMAREVFLGSVHARRAVEDLLTDLSGLDGSEERAAERIEDAILARDAAVPPVTEARRAVLKARAAVEKRSRVAAEERTARHALQERAIEAEVEEQWLALRLTDPGECAP